MPELAEVKLSADLIKPLINNNIILSVNVAPNSRYGDVNPEGFNKFIETIKTNSTRIIDIKTRGKFMYWTFDNGWYMFCTFGMTGQWSQKKGKHPCLEVQYTKDLTSNQIDNLFFNDPRHFGTIKFTDNERELTDKLKKMGWDALQHNLEKNLLFINNRLSKTNKPIAQVLLDQSIFAGVGNYIRAEALYEAKISPWRESNKLSKDEVKNLCECIINVVKTSYAHQGATIQTYKTAFGEEGKYSSLFKVYGRDYDPLGNKVTKETSAEGRTIHWVSEIQK